MENLFHLTNKNIIISGASSGIGKACAILASNLGANVILLGRDENKLQDVKSLLKSGEHLVISKDLTDFQDSDSLINQIVDKTGKISGFIHSAGIELTMPIKSLKPSDFINLFSINVIAGFEIAKQISKNKYISESGGSLIFISSIMGMVGASGLTAYSASKGALISGSRSLALELASKNIRVNCISPGYVKTEMHTEWLFESEENPSFQRISNLHPLGIGNPEDVANACMFLLSDLSKWITGSNLVVDGGYSIQ